MAQTSITLRADPIPIVDAEINGRPVRLEVDLRMPDALAMSNEAAQRLRVQRIPFVAVRISIEGGDASIRGRIARPRFEIDGRSSRAFAGVFPAPVTSRADGVIGPGALPHDVVIVELGPEQADARDIVFVLDEPDIWSVHADVGRERLRIGFNLSNQESVIHRTASRLFDASGAISAAGELTQTHLILGLSTLMQPVRTELTVEDLSLGPTLARTNAPLLGATEEDAVVVRGQVDSPPPPALTLGRAALERCSFMRVDRRTRQLTLRCAS